MNFYKAISCHHHYVKKLILFVFYFWFLVCFHFVHPKDLMTFYMGSHTAQAGLTM